jgi:hypothetical protein
MLNTRSDYFFDEDVSSGDTTLSGCIERGRFPLFSTPIRMSSHPVG